MTAEDAGSSAGGGVRQGTICNFGSQPLPVRIQSVQQPREKQSFGADFLNAQVQVAGQSVHEHMIFNDEVVELMAMDCDIPLAA